VLEKTATGSLGLKIAGGQDGKQVWLKDFVGEPARTANMNKLICTGMRKYALQHENVCTCVTGDRLVSVNGQPTQGLSHQEAVQLLKTATSPVTLGLWRPAYLPPPTPADVKQSTPRMVTITAKLKKPTSGSLGLSLATLGDTPGIYIRAVTPGSAAAADGTLETGDRFWTVSRNSTTHACVYAFVIDQREISGRGDCRRSDSSATRCTRRYCD
jgi:C-terminal processing protease CtpA/Prc